MSDGTRLSDTRSKQTETKDIMKSNETDVGSENRTDVPSSTYTLTNSIKPANIDVSKINYVATLSEFKYTTSLPTEEYSIQSFVANASQDKSEEEIIFREKFPVNVTSLMNEDNLWGSFYLFPELYANEFSPVVHIRKLQDVPDLVGGVLTRDMVTACLTYLKRTPILGDFVFIKLDLSSKHLMNIEVLKYYKYLVYLDLSSNLLTELTVLSCLPYIQFLKVAFNRLNTVLEYTTPQWFLTEVHYKYNSVKRIRDLSMFWSITTLDLSHNNIKCISGLENLKYLRRLDLSFNHIQRLENLNHLRLTWLDVSYNNISSFEFGPNSGLWTLQHLEYLNLNENNLTSMKLFSYCTRLRELHARNNRLSMLLQIAVYMHQMRRLVVLDLRANPFCAMPGYKDVVINTFSRLINLDAEEIDPIEQRSLIMDMKPDVTMHATRRLLRLLYIQQLSKAVVSPYVPPADTTDVPIVVIVGYEAVGKGTLARRLASECSAKIELAYLHTTAQYHDYYKEVTRSKFDDMLIAGEFLTYTEMAGDSYGLSRAEACVKDGKVKIVSMDLLGALMLKLRGYRPYLILATYRNTKSLLAKQEQRKMYRSNRARMSLETPLERSTLQVLLSGRIIITGIINEIILGFPEEKENSEFMIESECSLMMDSEARHYAKGINILALLASSATSLEEVCKGSKQDKYSMEERSLYSLFKESQGTDTAEYTSYVNGQNQGSLQERARKSTEPRQSRLRQEKHSSISQRKSISTGKGLMHPDSSKSSKSVTFTSQEVDALAALADPVGLMIEPRTEQERKEDSSRNVRSISIPWPARGQSLLSSYVSNDDSDLWLAFLTETGFIQASDTNHVSSDTMARHSIPKTEEESIMHQMYHKVLPDLSTTNIRDNYEHIHHRCPGLFWDTVTMDDPDEAFLKTRRIIRNIVNSQKSLKPMFDIDFANSRDYPTVEKRLTSIRNQIARQQLFY